MSSRVTVRFPDATAIDIAQAIAINDLLSNDPSDPNSHDTLLNAVEEAAPLALGPQPPPLSLRQRARNLVVPWKRAVVGRYGVNPVTIIAALTDDGKAALEDLCAQGDGPLSALEDTETHFARLAIIRPWLTDLGQPDPDLVGSSYLLFTCDGWGIGPPTAGGHAHEGSLADRQHLRIPAPVIPRREGVWPSTRG